MIYVMTVHVESSRFQSCVEDLEAKGYLKFLHNASGEILGFAPTYSGYRWRILFVLKLVDVVVLHILLPVIASVVKTLIVS